MDFHDFRSFLWKSGDGSHPPPRVMCRPSIPKVGTAEPPQSISGLVRRYEEAKGVMLSIRPLIIRKKKVTVQVSRYIYNSFHMLAVQSGCTREWIYGCPGRKPAHTAAFFIHFFLVGEGKDRERRAYPAESPTIRCEMQRADAGNARTSLEKAAKPRVRLAHPGLN